MQLDSWLRFIIVKGHRGGPTRKKTYQMLSGESRLRLPLFSLPGPLRMGFSLQQGQVYQHPRLSEGKHVFSLSPDVCTVSAAGFSRIQRPRRAKLPYQVVTQGPYQKPSSQMPSMGQPHRQALLYQGCYGNSFLHAVAVRINDSSWQSFQHSVYFFMALKCQLLYVT